MREEDWETLLARIEGGRCTPFLGAGACAGTLPLGEDIARRWAVEYRYPLEDGHDLARVAQFVGVHREDAMLPKELLVRELAKVPAPDFSRAEEPHAALADLPLPVYLTTNYDDFMTEALRSRGKAPRRDFCRWNSEIRHEPQVLDPDFAPSPAEPAVFHLHGHFEVAASIVLAEDDYLDFLVATSRDPDLIPHQILRSLASSSLLFVGYRLADLDFRVLHRGLVSATEPALRRLSVTVQLPHGTADAREYLDKYFGAMRVRVFWGTAEEFTGELRERWRARDAGG